MTNSIKLYVKADTMHSKDPSYNSAYVPLTVLFACSISLNLEVPMRSPALSLKLLYNSYIIKYCMINITIQSVLFFYDHELLKMENINLKPQSAFFSMSKLKLFSPFQKL